MEGVCKEIIGVINADGHISGVVASDELLCGTVNAENALCGIVNYRQCYEPPHYDGEYDVIPKAHEMQTLDTNGRLMEDDVRVQKIPYYETSNTVGTTVYIANEV